MLVRLGFLFFFFGSVVFAQKPNAQDKAYLKQDSIVVLSDQYILKSSVEAPNNFKVLYPVLSGFNEIRSLSYLNRGHEEFFINSKTNAIYTLKNDTIKPWMPSQETPVVGATYLVNNDTIFRYGGKKGLMNIDYWSFLDEVQNSWQPYPSFSSPYTPNGTFNNCYVVSDEAVVFMRGARINRRNLSDAYLDDHIIEYNWKKKEWRELGHTRADYKNFNKTISMGAELLFYNEKSLFYVNPFTNKNSLYYRNLTQLNLHKSDLLDALYHNGIFYAFMDGSEGIYIKKIPKSSFLGSIESVDAFYDPPLKPFPYELIGMLIFFIAAVFRPLKNLLIKDKIQLEKGGFKYAGVLHPVPPKSFELTKLLLEKSALTTQEIMSIVENPNISYSQNMKIKNQLIDNLNVVLKTILNITVPVIVDVKDENDHRVTVYKIDSSYFKK